MYSRELKYLGEKYKTTESIKEPFLEKFSQIKIKQNKSLF